MPDFWSHHLASVRTNDLFNQLSPLKWKWSDQALSCYYFGAQGPDLFFYINRTNPFAKDSFKELGSKLHNEKIGAVIKDMVRYAASSENEKVIAYVSGFISHYIMDAHCHPLISKWGPDSKSHKRVELSLDALTILDLTGKPIHQMSLDHWTFDPEIIQNDIAALWNHVLVKNFETQVPREAFWNATLDLLRIEKILLNDTVSKLPFKRPLSKLFHYDLSDLAYPHTLDSFKAIVDYDAYKTQYLKGIERTVIVLKRLDNLLVQRQGLDAWTETYFNLDYMGKEIQHAF